MALIVRLVKGPKLSAVDEDFEALRREPDPVTRGRRATELLAVYQQRSVELARLRRAAIEEARDQLGGSYTEVARAFGLTKGRITQIRNGAPPPHRAFFGVGPLDIALPGRRMDGREELVIGAADTAVGQHLTAEAGELAFVTAPVVIDPRQQWEPDHDAIVVCGPVSAHVGRALMDVDPVLGMSKGETKWSVVDKTTGEAHYSPSDDEAAPRRADHAYIARHVRDGQIIVHIAGLHSMGSVAAAHYVTENLADLWAQFPDRSFSMAVTGEFTDLTPTAITVLVPPKAWT